MPVSWMMTWGVSVSASRLVSESVDSVGEEEADVLAGGGLVSKISSEASLMLTKRLYPLTTLTETSSGLYPGEVSESWCEPGVESSLATGV